MKHLHHAGVALIIGVTATAHLAVADFTGVVVEERPASTSEEIIFGVYAVFDSPTDRLIGVTSPAEFNSTIPLYNDPSGFDLNFGIDFDSWVTIGAELGMTRVSFGWPGGPGLGSDFIGGTSWSLPDGERWFIPTGPGVLASQSDDGLANHLLIANFAFEAVEPGEQTFSLEGVAVVNFDSSVWNVPFSLVHTYEIIPTPGAAALFGAAGFVGGRRRRR
jgi:hypothetical protein